MAMRLKVLTAVALMILSANLSAQENIAEQRGFHKDLQYLKNIQYGSTNPAAISSIAFDIVDINLGFGYENGDLHDINAPSAHRRVEGGVYGAKKLEKVDFEGTIKYSNEKLKGKKWRSTLFVDNDNPFFLADSIAGDNTVETFLVEGGLSYRFAKGWRAGIRATYNVGSLTDQFDPRPDTRSMDFKITPGIDYSFGNYTIGLAGHIGWLSENTSYIKVGLENKNNTIYMFRGLGKPVTQVVDQNLGWRRDYSGMNYGGSLQFIWDNRSNLANILEAAVDIESESAVDGGSRFKYLGGDYKAMVIGLRDRMQICRDNLRHNIEVCGELKSVDGIWFTQVAGSDKNGLTIYEVKEESISHEEEIMALEASYRMDIMREGYPTLNWKVKAGYKSSSMMQYPEEYSRKWSALNVDAQVTKYFRIKKSILGVSLCGGYNYGLSNELEMNPQNTKFDITYHTPEIAFLSAGYASAGGKIFFNIPLATKKSIIWLGGNVSDRYSFCTGSESMFDKTDRNILQAALTLAF